MTTDLQTKEFPDVESELDVLDLLIEVVKAKNVIGVWVFLAIFVGAVVTIIWPNSYSAKTALMPPQADGFSAMALAGQAGGLLGGLAGGALGLQTPADLYAGVLQSEAVAERVIRKHSLNVVYQASSMVDAKKVLEKKVKINVSREGLIEIEVEDAVATRAAAIANSYVVTLRELVSEMGSSGAAERRAYFEGQLAKIRENLALAEVSLKSAQEKTGLLDVSQQAKVILESIATLQGLIAAKEVEISAIRSFATEQNPDLKRALQELSSLKSQLAGAENKRERRSGEILVPTSSLPAAALEYLRYFREAKYQEALYEVISKYVELARIEEGFGKIIIQQVGVAEAPDKPFWPRASLILPFSAIAGLLGALIYVIGGLLYRQIGVSSKRGTQLAAFLQALRN